MAFESVKQEESAIWQPTQTGSKKEGNITPLKSEDKSWIVGYYLGSKEITIGANTSTLHKLQCESVGNKKHIIGDVDRETKEVSVWGTAVLTDNLTKINVGDFIKIVWEGKIPPKKAGGNHYHDWDVQVDNSVEPLRPSLGNTSQAPESSPVSEKESNDDLPF